jgi:hypothetical protein
LFCGVSWGDVVDLRRKKGGDLHVADVAFEMLHVDGVEADDCREEADVGFCDVRGGEEVRG